MKKTVSLLLTLCLILSIGVSAFAASPENVKQYPVYTSLGDSIPSFAKWLNPDGTMELTFDEKPGSYPALLKDYFGAVHNSWSFGGMTTQGILYMLDDSYDVDENVFRIIGSQYTAELFDNARDAVNKSIEESDIITLNVGANDVLTSSMFQAMDLSADDLYCGTGIEELDEKIQSLLDTSTFVSMLTYYMEQNYLKFYHNFPTLLCELKSRNENADLIVIGIYNPMEGMTLSSEVAIKVGDSLSLMTERLNIAIRYFAEMYGCTFVDINGTESYFMASGGTFSDEGLFNAIWLDIHPTKVGHQYIAERIVDALPERRSCTVSLDVSELKNVDTVYIDGVAYPAVVENGIAAVECENQNFKTATVYGWKTLGKYTRVYTQKAWTLKNDDGVFEAKYYTSLKNPLLYTSVNTLVAANYGRSVILGK